ncbi:Serine/threonine-protein kinase [Dirofilaria immitis]
MGNNQSSSCLNDSTKLEKYNLNRKTTLRQNFLCNLLRKSRWITAFFTRTNLTNSENQSQNRNITTVKATECSLKNRPALRLDSRLVCKYEVLAVIGKGSFSQVLRVQHRLTHKYYAVKLVSSDCGTVNNELSILSRVQHPFVIKLEEVFKSSSRLFIVMEMASGGEMYNRVVAKGRYSEGEARQALRMLLNGLAYLHSIRVTHRDLKPENLLYSDTTPDARLLITDFGLAYQAQTSEEKMTETCGTPEYIAPEVLLRSAYTEKVDMWAVGVIAYILMSGIMPFDDDCRSRLYTQIITANYIYYPQFWSGSELAKDFVDALLETDPNVRLSAIDAVKHEWFMGNRNQLKVIIKTRPASDFTTIQRTRSSRSIRSVTRSDHGHRVDPREVDRLASDLQRLAKFQQQSTKHYDH